MCMMNNMPVNAYHTPCNHCVEYLNTCMPVIINGFIFGECDLCYCEFCPCYENCMNGGVDDETVKL